MAICMESCSVSGDGVDHVQERLARREAGQVVAEQLDTPSRTRPLDHAVWGVTITFGRS
jgi:hypothetical protein